MKFESGVTCNTYETPNFVLYVVTLGYNMLLTLTSVTHCTHVTLIFDLSHLWPWKPFQQCTLTWWIFRPSFPLLSHAALTTDGRTDVYIRPENIMPSPLIIGGGCMTNKRCVKY